MEEQVSKLNELATALAKAQSEMKAPLKNRTVDFQPAQGARVRYSYADLADVLESVKGPLSKNGLSVHSTMIGSGETFGIQTTLLHSSGQSVSTWYPLPDPKSLKPQTFGSAMTYARRYSISALIGIASEEDDDGQAAAYDEPSKKYDVSQDVRPVSEAQIKRMFAISKQKGISEAEQKHLVKKCYGLDSTKDLVRWQIDEVFKLIEQDGANSATVMAFAESFNKGASNG